MSANKTGALPAPPPAATKPLSTSNVWEPPPSWSGRGCAHLVAWLEAPAWQQDYHAVLQFVNSARLQKVARKTVLQKGSTVCFKCGEGPMRRLHVSLHSPYVACKEGGCMEAHLKASGNALGIDMMRGEVYCFECKDFVYDLRLEQERADFLDKITRASDRDETATSTPQKRQHAAEDEGRRGGGIAKYCLPRRSGWVPTPEQVQVLKSQATQPDPEAGIAGLRGMHNLGNTCFLNCVLQGLVNNPGVRDYFLGDYHNRHRCKLKRERSGQLDQVCMGCEMDKLVEECFQGSKTAFSPHSFLFGMWKSSQNLAGYEQHDAHECFISVLDQLQDACKNDLAESGRHNTAILKRLFQGIMRSDVTCLECGTSSFTKDPFLDISLDLSQEALASADIASASDARKGGRQGEDELRSSSVAEEAAAGALDAPGEKAEGQTPSIPTDAGGKTQGRSEEEGAASGGAGAAGVGGRAEEASAAQGAAGWAKLAMSHLSLEDCLRRFTAVEKLDKKSLWQCEACKETDKGAAAAAAAAAAAPRAPAQASGGIKQLSIQMLAPSLCVQLKRFESSCYSGSQQSIKIDAHVSFPLRLNLAPFVSHSVLKRGKQWLDEHLRPAGNGSAGADAGPGTDRGEDGMVPIWYALYAVVVHHGRMDSGHYTSFVRRGKDWFACDDSAVVLVSEQQVLECQAYLLYYVSCEH